MKKQDQLFYLIKSLSDSEKHRFKKKINKGKNYLQLFDAINSQEEYNENEIKELFKDKTFVKQLHVTKNYLIKEILKSIRSGNSSVNIRINNLLSEIEILYQRELFDQCSYLIEKTISLAKAHEKNNYLAILLNWKSKINIHHKNASEIIELIQETIKQQRMHLQYSLIENDYWKLTISQFEYFAKPAKEKKSFYSNPLLQDIENAKTLRSKINFYHINYTNAVTSNDSNKALEYLDRLILILETNPSRIIEEPSAYITTLNNKVSLLLNMKRYEAIPKILEIIRNIPKKLNLDKRDKIAVRLTLRTYNIELEMYRDLKDYIKAESLVEEIENFIECNQKSITNDYIVLFYYQFAYIYFMLGRFDKALKWTNKVFNNDFEKIRNDLYTYSRFLNLMIHFELDNGIVLKYAVDATRKYLRKKGQLQNFEKVLLRFFSKISMTQKSNRNKLFLDLKDNIFAKTDQNKQNEILDYIDFEEWITSKLNYL